MKYTHIFNPYAIRPVTLKPDFWLTIEGHLHAKNEEFFIQQLRQNAIEQEFSFINSYARSVAEILAEIQKLQDKLIRIQKTIDEFSSEDSYPTNLEEEYKFQDCRSQIDGLKKRSNTLQSRIDRYNSKLRKLKIRIDFAFEKNRSTTIRKILAFRKGCRGNSGEDEVIVLQPALSFFYQVIEEEGDINENEFEI